ncbi:hypothetical protein BH09PSE6_BH09PSE6_06670 [soil metagenome]
MNSSPTSKRILHDIAWAHCGDKGDMVNIGVVARHADDYALLVQQATSERVARHFRDICRGTVRRYELPNLNAVNFVLTRVLDGGPMRSLRLDPQGKTLGDSLLLLEIDEVDCGGAQDDHRGCAGVMSG